MLTIAIIGGIGCGKSTALKFFQDKHIACFSADDFARQLTQMNTPQYKFIVEHVGPDCLHPNGELNRGFIRQKMLQDASFKQWLEQLLHPKIKQLLLKSREKAHSPYCVLEIPLLNDKQSYNIDRVLNVDCDLEQQIYRLQSRGLTQDDIQGLLNHQVAGELRDAITDDRIVNNGDIHSFYHQLEQLHQYYLKRATGVAP
jgi:dephospho-CoA kinase